MKLTFLVKLYNMIPLFSWKLKGDVLFLHRAGDKYLRKMEEERFFQNTNYDFTGKQKLI